MTQKETIKKINAQTKRLAKRNDKKLALRLQRKGWFGLSKLVVSLTERI